MKTFASSFGKFARDCAIACAPFFVGKAYDKAMDWKRENEQAIQKKLSDIKGLLRGEENNSESKN